MRSLLKNIFLIFALALFAGRANAAAYSKYSSESFTTQDGLIQSDVKDLLQDSYGFIWVATNGGISRFDGNDFRTFVVGELGLETNLILSFAQDKQGNIWIGTADKGLYCYAREKERFIHYKELLGKTKDPNLKAVRFLACGPSGDIWGVDNTLSAAFRISYNPKFSQIDQIDSYPINREEGERLINAFIATPTKVYMATNKNLYNYSLGADKFVPVKSRAPLALVTDMRLRGEVLHILSFGRFLGYNIRTGRITSYKLPFRPLKFHWAGGKMWFVTAEGVFVAKYYPKVDRFAEIERVDKFHSLSPQAILSDNAGGVYVGFQKEGIRRYDVDRAPFMTRRGMGNDHILPILALNDEALLVGTEGSGAYILDSLNATPRPLPIPPSQTVYSFSENGDSLLVATSNGVYTLKKDLKEKNDLKLLFEEHSVRKLMLDGDFLWMASYSRGLLRMNLKTRELSELNCENCANLPSNTLRNVLLDSKKNLWITSERGVAFLPAKERFREKPQFLRPLSDSLGGNYAIPIMESSKGEIWYGTMGYGLYRLSPKLSSKSKTSAEQSSGFASTFADYDLRHYNTNDGLSSNTIKAILEDESGAIWVSTNRGICRLRDLKNGVDIVSFDLRHGLQDYEFNELSAAKTPGGDLVFGGVDGFNYFHPSMFSENEALAIPILTDFTLDGESVFDGTLSKELPQGLNGKNGIRLKYNQNSFTLAFSAMQMDNPQKNLYQYQLEGMDLGWVSPSQGVREASYTNLSPGNYTFFLRVANSDGKWTKTPLSIPIYIDPPFWRTIYAYIIYSLLLLLLGFFVISYFHDMMERRNTMRMVRLERQKIEEMLELRTHFFTNISHEFRTPLTLVLSPLQSLLADEDLRANKRWARLLNTMAHNGNSLMRLVNDFLSYTKHESGGLTASLSRNDFNALIRRLAEQFEFWAEQRGVRLVFEASPDALMMDFDPYLIEQVVYNLMSNAIKNTPKGGQITLKLEQEGEATVLLSVSDTGCGIAEHLQGKIFERYFSRTTDSSRDVGGTGVGLYLSQSIVNLHGGNLDFESKEGEGTSFFVRLPRKIEGDKIEGQKPLPFSDLTLSSDLGDLEKQDDTQKVQETINDSDILTGKVSLNEPSNSLRTNDENDEAEQAALGLPKETKLVTPTLLIADDNTSLLQLLSELFESDYSILTAEDGEQALALAIEHQPDIIISDVMMPKMGGIELCQRIKESDLTSHIPLVMLSAKASSDDLTAGYRVSADAYCAKPFNNALLRETVNSLLQNRRKLAAKYASLQPLEQTQSLFVEYGESATTNTDKLFLKKLTDYVEQNLHNPDLVVSDLCSFMGVSSLVLNKKLKSLLDMTANSMIRSVRLRRAAALLKTARYTIADVTYDVGFSDLRYFRECFKKEYGVLPQEYKDKALRGELDEQTDEEITLIRSKTED